MPLAQCRSSPKPTELQPELQAETERLGTFLLLVFAEGMLVGGHDKVVWLLHLQHHPHHPNVVLATQLAPFATVPLEPECWALFPSSNPDCKNITATDRNSQTPRTRVTPQGGPWHGPNHAWSPSFLGVSGRVCLARAVFKSPIAHVLRMLHRKS